MFYVNHFSLCFYFFYIGRNVLALHSFPTRRSSDLRLQEEKIAEACRKLPANRRSIHELSTLWKPGSRRSKVLWSLRITYASRPDTTASAATKIYSVGYLVSTTWTIHRSEEHTSELQ